MSYSIKIYSEKEGEISKFLKLFFNKEIDLENKLFWKKDFENPVDFIDLISCFIDNKEKFNANMWINLDKDVYICVTEKNSNELIKYIYERFPY